MERELRRAPSPAQALQPQLPVDFYFFQRWAILQRVVTNVGLPNSRHTVKVAPPAEVAVSVTPGTLPFREINERKIYTISMESVKNEQGRYAEGQLAWIHAKYKVRSPISVTWEGG
ncbi:hypothetical protein ZIOFF_044156 [Zingiber officinale]|uniref:Subtilisin-like protease fibronectin type-III domain-containing protein n=1 Tax=Zingiber officinale TaxID=94328 RepID=A0A8J5FUP4_ZINOF|nr:hypothetical protein ZIOFF_044156 [Zingiber officinale]